MSTKRSLLPGKARGARPTASAAKAATMKRLASMGGPFSFFCSWPECVPRSSDGAEIAMNGGWKKAPGKTFFSIKKLSNCKALAKVDPCGRCVRATLRERGQPDSPRLGSDYPCPAGQGDRSICRCMGPERCLDRIQDRWQLFRGRLPHHTRGRANPRRRLGRRSG